MRAYLHTLGCKVNAVETDSIAALLRDAGHSITDVPADADLIVLNTCTVTASGD
ncbi:MAG: tRNA (N(6)-L-threonylcarbamoyladenosine(37)-C(2))-methylthiotransferase MtaB, partial [Oscillospiraceae bacterium]|nr:tRNA (N(6)-L-threonylcarbamoyladenosine(37)-C(2))-methylthiotransferase MtaB [Oscillospiraceae bacterium]